MANKRKIRYILKVERQDRWNTLTHILVTKEVLLSSKVSKLLYNSQYDFNLRFDEEFRKDHSMLSFFGIIPYKVINKRKVNSNGSIQNK